jgi:type II secretory pathway predicted ATPase ExeA
VEHLSTFGLTRDPFANEPQLDLFFESQSVREAATRLRRAAQQGKGLVVLTGAGGLGKTMLVRSRACCASCAACSTSSTRSAAC